MSVGEVLGYMASMLVFTTFYMKTMVPLRLTAIASNFAFIGYGAVEGLNPVLVLHLALLPLNVRRYFQIRNMMDRLEPLRTRSENFKALAPHMLQLRMNKGEVIFKKGDRADAFYFVARGRVALPELGETVGDGGIIGEFGVFSSARTRVTTAYCETQCEIYSLSEARIQELCHQNPGVAFAVVRLITDYLQWNRQREPDGRGDRSPDRSRKTRHPLRIRAEWQRGLALEPGNDARGR